VELEIPDAVQSIEESALSNCSSLRSVDLPPNLTSIGSSAFRYCEGLELVELPGSLSFIGSNAFSECRALKTTIFLGDAPMIEGEAFRGVSSDFAFYYFGSSSGFTSPEWENETAIEINLTQNPAAIWLLRNSLPPLSDLELDLNKDGVSLLLAYAFNLDPKKNLSGSLPTAVFTNDKLTLDFYAIATGIDYSAEYSIELGKWSSETVILSEIDPDGYRTASIPIEGPRRFLRLNAKERTGP
jgi:hypothetical protein